MTRQVGMLSLVVLALLALPSAAQVTTYTYTGAPYTAVTAPYVAGGNVTGTFTTSAPLPAFLSYRDILPYVQSASFSDGVSTRTLATSFICSFKVATDGAGNITQWDILLRQQPYTPLSPQHSIETHGRPGPITGNDVAGTGNAGAGPCDPIALTSSGTSSTQGSWTDTFNMTTTPTTYTYTGAPYTTATAPYVLGANLTGTITTLNPLPPFMPITDATPFLASMSFNDTAVIRTLANSVLCSFQIATDGAGNITYWQMEARSFPYTTGNPQHSIYTSGRPGVLTGTDIVGTGNAGPNPCDPLVLSPTANSSVDGTWTDNNPLASQPTTYTYTGDPYTTATAPYVLGGNITGTLITANPLPPFMPFTDITPAITSISFNDGVATRTLANSFLCSVKAATDGAGNITRWEVFLRQFPYTTGMPQHSIESSGAPPGNFQGSDIAGTGTAGVNPCDGFIANPFGATASQGTWTDTNPLVTQPATYQYTGDPFTVAIPPYVIGGRVTGNITTSAPLPPLMPLSDITPALISFTYTDGVQTRTLANSTICTFRVATDGAGSITQWQVTIRQFPFTTGSPQQTIDSTGNPGFPDGSDLGGTGLAGVSPCSPFAATVYGSSDSAGTWTGSATGSIASGATLDGVGLVLLALLLAAAALYATRSG